MTFFTGATLDLRSIWSAAALNWPPWVWNRRLMLGARAEHHAHAARVDELRQVTEHVMDTGCLDSARACHRAALGTPSGTCHHMMGSPTPS